MFRETNNEHCFYPLHTFCIILEKEESQNIMEKLQNNDFLNILEENKVY